ncbi:serine hydrolase [Deinococcus sp.]|uniref:serine hydrolase domain-containing protein n=1 Tax=Deinococcus sp. TaxID=47478 RepID=UPI0025DF4278|nr:serine hydrolase [Deinococcus sp.]
MSIHLPTADPETQGVPSQAISAFIAATQSAGLELHAFELLRRGQILASGAWAPFTLERPHALFSVSKSFVSTAVGLAVSDGLLELDDTVLSVFPEYAPPQVSDHLAAMRVRDLLTMTSGHAEDVMRPLTEHQPQLWVRTFLAQPVDHAPGSRFVYNSAATFMLAAIVERRSGQRLLDLLSARLFEPLSITGASWDTNAEGTVFGGWGLYLPVDALARLGQLYLQGGEWEGQQLLPAHWVEQATSAQVPNAESSSASAGDWAQGYGFQFWRCRHGAYRADGALGQFIVVMPEQQAVLAILSAVDDMQAVLDQVWTHLLPAFGDGTLPPDPAALSQLRETCRALKLPPVRGEGSSESAASSVGRTYRFASNSLGLNALRFEVDSSRVELTLHTDAGSFILSAGMGHWTQQATDFDHVTATDRPGPRLIAGSAAWTSQGTLECHFKYLDSPGTHVLKLTVLAGGHSLRAESFARTTFRPVGALDLVGSTES